MHEALTLVKRDLGRDAVILQTRAYKKGGMLGFGGKTMIEVTAAVGVNVLPAGRRQPLARAEAGPHAAAAGTALASKSEPVEAGRQQNSIRSKAAVLGAYAAVARKAANPSDDSAVGASLTPPPAVNPSELKEVQKELHLLRGMVAEHVKESRKAHGPALPDELMRTYQQLIENQVAEEIVYQVLDALCRTLTREQLQDEQRVRAELLKVIETSLPESSGIDLKPAGTPHVVAFIGPTGVGKTTTIAKLAANFKLRGRCRVGLITIDTYRIAAVDQLRMYAQILDVPLQVVLTPRELVDAIAKMRDRDVILVDTAGRSHNDAIRIQELKSFIEAADPDEVHLVLSSAASEKNLLQAVERFNQVRVDKIVFTKLDEAVGFGVVLNVLKRVDKALSYVTMGQDVPDDIAPGKRSELAALIAGGQPMLMSRSLSLGS
jgi:flagellar biosynthesis protein FlhF